MSKIVRRNLERERAEGYDFEEAGNTRTPRGPFADQWRSHDQGDRAHGVMRQPD